MSEAQAHDYSTMPFGSHEESARLDRAERKRKKEQEMAKAREAAVARLQRPEIGCSAEEAETLVDQIGVDFIKANSDEAVAEKVSDARDEVEAEAYDPTGDNIDEVKAYVEAHPDEVDAVLAAEESSAKPRVTLIAHLQELSGSAGSGSGDADTPAGSEDAAVGPHFEGPSDGDDTGGDADVSDE